VTPVSVAISRPTRRWNTVAVLKGTRTAILALDLLLLLAVILGTQVHRAAMQTVGKDTAPTIIDAQRLKSALADMDANAANELLGPPGAATPAAALYDARRIESSETLIEAAKNTPKGSSGQTPIETLQVTTGTYERLVQQALDLNETAQPELAARYYRHAGLMMDYALLPAADQLDQANDAVLERTYKSEGLRSFGTRALLLLAGLLLLAALTGAQMFLAKRMRRTLNPALLAATVAALWLTIAAFAGMGGEEHHLKIVKEDAFTSIRALWRARATAYSANGDESRYLLDPLHASDYEATFVDKTRLLVNLSPSTSPEQAVAAAERGDTPLKFTGYLADELNNITFAGERDAALETLAAFQRYMAIDAQIRQMERAGRHQEAINLCIGSSEGESDWAFDQFDAALRKTLDINQAAFDESVKQGFDAVGELEIEACAAALAIAVLTVLGLAGRIREYQ
jgi:hypothetical protein